MEGLSSTHRGFCCAALDVNMLFLLSGVAKPGEFISFEARSPAELIRLILDTPKLTKQLQAWTKTSANHLVFIHRYCAVVLGHLFTHLYYLTGIKTKKMTYIYLFGLELAHKSHV